MELWKSMPNFSKYEASTLGNVRNKNTKYVLKPTQDRGYLVISKIMDDNNKRKHLSIHRAIAVTFIPNPMNKETVNHINHNPLDNRVENLEWASKKEQIIHQRKPSYNVKKLCNARKVLRICIDTDEVLQKYESIRDAVRWLIDNKYKSTTSHIDVSLCSKKIAYGFKWKYDNEPVYEDEIWKQIPKEIVNGTEGYMISSYGRVKNKSGRLSKGSTPIEGDYIKVNVYPKLYRLHILVAKTFIPNPENKKVVNHIDGNKINNRVENLEWVSFSENSKHAYDTGLNSNSNKVKISNIHTGDVFKYNSIMDCSKDLKRHHNTIIYWIQKSIIYDNTWKLEYL